LCLSPSYYIYSTDRVKKVLESNTDSHSITFHGIEDYYGLDGKVYVRFTVEVVDDHAKSISDISEVNIDSRSMFYWIAMSVNYNLMIDSYCSYH